LLTIDNLREISDQAHSSAMTSSPMANPLEAPMPLVTVTKRTDAMGLR